jgi:hypothetical protein
LNFVRFFERFLNILLEFTDSPNEDFSEDFHRDLYEDLSKLFTSFYSAISISEDNLEESLRMIDFRDLVRLESIIKQSSDKNNRENFIKVSLGFS